MSGRVRAENPGERFAQGDPIVERGFRRPERLRLEQVFPTHSRSQTLVEPMGIGVDHQQTPVRRFERPGGSLLRQWIWPDPRPHRSGREEVVEVEAHQRHAGLEHGDVEETALAGTFPPEQRGIDCGTRDDCGARVRDCKPDAHRLLRCPGCHEHAGLALDEVVERGPTGFRSTLPVARDGAVDDPFVVAPHGLVVDPETFGCSRAHVQHEDVRRTDQRLYRFATTRVLEVDGNRSFAAALAHEARRHAGFELYPHATHLIARARGFNLDDLGPIRPSW